MKTLEMAQATDELASYAKQVRRGPVVVTDHGRPVMALVSIENADLETVTLSTDPRFMALIRASRARQGAGEGASLEEVKRKYGIRSTPVKRRSRRARR